MRKSLIVVPAMLLVASCAAEPVSEDPAQQDTPQVVGPPTSAPAPKPITLDEPRTFEFLNDSGTVGSLTIPGEPYAPMDEFLSLVGETDPVTYATMDVDNRNASDEYGLYEVNLYTPEGEQFTLQGLNNEVVERSEETPEAAQPISTEITDEFFEDTAVGQRRTEYVVTDESLPNEVTRVEVVQTGGSAVQVYPELDAGGVQ
ncbi:hypothetical protein [Kocuria rosea]|uniref:hypothetical protein n=1 Tax=Kocuria rosea TaxID=1275 RepID=UPI000F6F8F87|nr:hypothetical protein [Kocuria rosea]VEI49331.1 Uncharacterised protein [Kocuria rosea]